MDERKAILRAGIAFMLDEARERKRMRMKEAADQAQALKTVLTQVRDTIGVGDYAKAQKLIDSKVAPVIKAAKDGKLNAQLGKIGALLSEVESNANNAVQAASGAEKQVKAAIALVKKLERQAGGAFVDQEGTELFTRKPVVANLNAIAKELAKVKGMKPSELSTVGSLFVTQVLPVVNQVQGKNGQELKKAIGRAHLATKVVRDHGTAIQVAHQRAWDATTVLQRFYNRWAKMQGR